MYHTVRNPEVSGFRPKLHTHKGVNMTKGLKLSIVASAFLAVSAFAGTVAQTPYSVASEYAAKNNLAEVIFNIGDKAGLYTPSEITAISVGNPTVKVSIPGAMLNNNIDSNLSLVQGDFNASNNAFTPKKVIAKFTNAYNGALALQTSTGVSITNGLSYKLMSSTQSVGDDVNGSTTDLSSSALTLTGVPTGTTSLNLKFETISTDTQLVRDTGVAKIFDAARQVTAAITTAANGIIDATTSAFKLFVGNTDIDNIDVNVTAASRDTSAVGNGDSASIKIVSSAAFPADMNASSVATACTFATDRMSVVCPIAPTSNGDTNATTITFTAGGTNPITAASFTAEVGYDFNNTSADYLIGTNPVTTAEAGKWTYNGSTLKAPYLVLSTAAASFATISNESNQNAKVFVDLFDEAGEKVANVPLVDLAPHSSHLYLATDIVAAAKLHGASATFASINGGRFTAVFLVTAPKENVFGSAVVKQISGADRVTPLKDNSGFGQ